MIGEVDSNYNGKLTYCSNKCERFDMETLWWIEFIDFCSKYQLGFVGEE
jgi:hypothetical protein